MKILVFLPVALLLAGCATKVQHTSKSPAEMRADVRFCKSEATRRYSLDPVAALYHAYGCLDAKGYERGSAFALPEVGRALSGSPAAPTEPAGQPVKPCAVPCRKSS